MCQEPAKCVGYHDIHAKYSDTFRMCSGTFFYLQCRVRRFGGVREQTNTQTHSHHPIAIEEG